MSKDDERLLEILDLLVDDAFVDATIAGEVLGESELRELNALLDGNPGNQLLYKRYLDLHCQLDLDIGPAYDTKQHAGKVEVGAERQAASLAAESHLASVATLAQRHRRWLTAVCASGIVLGALVLEMNLGSQASVDAAMGEFDGDVIVTCADGETRPVSHGMEIQAGDAIETRGENSFATLEFSDQARFVLVSNSSASLGRHNLRNVVFRSGRLLASLESAPTPNPLVVAARHASVRVLGDFAMESTDGETNLSVLQGRVGVSSASGDNSAEVSAGEYLVAVADEEFVIEKQSDNDGWNVDFENGLPASWTIGIFESEDLPSKSKGGVRAAKNEIGGQVYYQVNAPHEWARGYVKQREDLHLNVTFKMDRPDWVNVFLIARTSDPKNHKTYLHKYTIGSEAIAAGTWWKVSVPLSEFQLKTSKGFENIPPVEDELFFGMSFSSPAPSRGFVVDRISVQRGGPGKVVYERLN